LISFSWLATAVLTNPAVANELKEFKERLQTAEFIFSMGHILIRSIPEEGLQKEANDLSAGVAAKRQAQQQQEGQEGQGQQHHQEGQVRQKQKGLKAKRVDAGR
jgi:hypothetical protein